MRWKEREREIKTGTSNWNDISDSDEDFGLFT